MPITLNGTGPVTGITSINTSVSDTELGYLDGVTSAIQNQINDSKSYAQINKIAGQTMASGFDSILLDEVTVSKDISLVSNQIKFNISGIYYINVGFRFGTGADVWTGVNLWNTTTGIVGQSFGTGQVANDPGPAMFNFMANISNISVNYSVRTYRAGATVAVATPDTNAGRAFVVTILKVS